MSKISELYNKNKRIIENFSYLTILQGINMLIPLFIFPYLIKVLGSKTYGLIIYAQAIIGYFVVIISFGFNITATKEISIYKHNLIKINKILSSIFILKGILFLASAFFLTLLVLIIPEFWEYRALFYLTLWMCLYELLFPIYFFQGIEEMKHITLITLLMRSFFITLIFFLVNDRDDYLLVPIINGFGALIAGIVSQYIIFKKGIRYFWQPYYVLKFYFKKSYIMAIAYASNTLKSNLNIVLIKFLFSFKEVAYFDLAFKISQIGSSFLELISVSVFPKMSREKNKSFLIKVIKLCMGLSIAYVILIQFIAPNLIIILGGLDMLESINILKLLVVFVPFQIIGGLLGRNCLIVNGYDKDVLYSMIISSVIYISLTAVFYFFIGKISLILLGGIFVFSFAIDTFYRYYKCKIYKII